MSNVHSGAPIAAPQPDLSEIQRAAVSHPIQLYFNGFINNLSPADISTALLRNGVIIGMLQMSYTTAKTYAQSLQAAISHIESVTGTQITPTPEATEKLAASPLS